MRKILYSTCYVYNQIKVFFIMFLLCLLEQLKEPQPIKISSTPRFLSSVKTESQNFAPSFSANQRLRSSLLSLILRFFRNSVAN